MNEFEKVIKAHLVAMAKEDAVFAQKYQHKMEKMGGEAKLIASCCGYICEEVKKTRRQGFADDEIYAMATHYIDEESLGEFRGVNAHVVVNHSIGLSDDDKNRLIAEAEAEFKAEHKRGMLKKMAEEKDKEGKPVKPKKEKPQPAAEEPSLFSFD